MHMLCFVMFLYVVKQKTAYEVRMSDGSSDVCASDLPAEPRVRVPPWPGVRLDPARRRDQPRIAEDPVGAAGGHGGVARHDRRRTPRGRAALPRHRNAE